MQRYNPKEIEAKWQQKWQEDRIYEASEDGSKPKRYVLEYFPYPSGAAMHVGHVRNYTIGDATARFARMNGYNVLHPMGWDAFGLPAENYAIKNNISPQEAIAENTSKFKKQLMQMGFSYDWSREINSSDPNNYKWTQYFFNLLLKKGLAYQKESLQWWCDFDKTVLANEQVEAGKCWRCGNTVGKKALKQWFFKITDYADRLIDDLDKLDWSEAIKSMQRNWIGKSEGSEIDFKIDGSQKEIKVFTTRPDTIYGATFMVLAPEHPLVEEITTPEQRAEVESYIKATQSKSDVERQETNRKKTGVATGAHAINPATNEKVPVWIADYVLMGYGTGAIMAVPARDERDGEFAEKYSLPVSDAELTEEAFGKKVINYKIRDWLISRQRYWGAPIPIIHCEKDGIVPVPDNQLPVVLPEVESYAPTGEGTSVLASVSDWVNVDCPKCGGPAKRETDTMDGFACSSWYFLRFADPHNDQEPFDKEKAKFWLPVDDYIGGAEHAVMHLLYARMWTKVMYDEGMIDFDEPFSKLRNQGMILAPDGRKMSKSWGNTITPDEIIEQGYGADAIRVMELFIGPWDQSANWSIEGMGGCFRFLQRFWTLVQEFKESTTLENHTAAQELLVVGDKAAKKVTNDLETMGFNTAIAALMECVNELYKIKAQDNYAAKSAWKTVLTKITQLLAPFAPHMTEELWAQLGNEGSVHVSEWPKWDESNLVQNTITLAVQVNGKLRGEVEVSADASQEEILEAAKSVEKVAGYLEGHDIKKSIVVPGRLVSFVI